MTDTRETILVVFGFLAVVAAISGAALWFLSLSCSARWSDSGMNSRFAVFSGCRVEVSPGVWLPASAIRDVDIRRGGKP